VAGCSGIALGCAGTALGCAGTALGAGLLDAPANCAVIAEAYWLGNMAVICDWMKLMVGWASAGPAPDDPESIDMNAVASELVAIGESPLRLNAVGRKHTRLADARQKCPTFSRIPRIKGVVSRFRRLNAVENAVLVSYLNLLIHYLY